jgi:hypothetical protein
MNEPATTNLKTSLAHRTVLQKALKQVIELNKMLAIDLRRYQSEPSYIDLDLAHDLGLTLERAIDRAIDRAYDRSFDE